MDILIQNDQKRTFFRWFNSFLIGCVAGSACLSAQDEETDEEVYELSPFAVDAGDDLGYRAAQTLAGTRISTSLKNVSAQVDIMTEEFLQDIAATNIEDAQLYSLNVEGSREYYGDPKDDGQIGVEKLNTAARVRGLANASKTRDFFPTLFQIDAYNSDRFTFNSGPNAILFGLGSPGGVINQGSMKANFTNANQIGFRFDSEDSYRMNFNVNHELIENKLAIRVGGLYENEKNWKKPSFDRKERFFATLSYKPWERTTVRASIENIDREANIPRNTLIRDGVTPYLEYREEMMAELGITDPLDPRLYWAEGDLKDNTTPFANGFNRIVLVTGAFEEIPSYNMLGNSRGGGATSRLPQQLEGVESVDNFGRSLTDESIYPYDINLGGATVTEANGYSGSLFVEQQILDNLFLEFAYQKESRDQDFTDWLRGSDQVLRIDVERYLPSVDPDAEPVLNPNRGKYYTESWSRGSTQLADSENARLTASYELDFTERDGWSRWLGKHNLAGLVDKSELEEGNQNYRGSIYPTVPDDIAIVGTGSSAANFRAYHRTYLDDPSDPAGSTFYLDPNKHVTGLDNEPYAGYDSLLVAFRPDPSLEYGVWAGGSFKTEETEGRMLATQSSFLDGKVVVTYGKRWDDFKSKIITTSREDNAPAPYNTRQQDISKLSAPDLSDPDLDESGGQETKGIVVFPLPWLSFHYNESSNRIAGTAGLNVATGNFHDPSSGEGEDYGVRFELLDGNFFLKLNWYENSQTRNTSQQFDGLRWDFNSIETRLASWVEDPTTPPISGTFKLPENYDTSSTADALLANVLSDLVADGLEITATYNPTKNWRISFNASKTESTETNIANTYREYIENERLAEWMKFSDRAFNSENGQVAVDDEQTVQEWIDKNIFFDFLDLATAVEGQPTDRVPEWRANLVNNYQFTEGKLEGFGVGGAIRWRDERTIGLPVEIIDGRVTPDIDNPYKDDGVTDIDAWFSYKTKLFNDKVNARFQLNIRNILDDDDLLPQVATSTGEVALYKVQTPRTFIFSTTFDF
ncbi:hypothetical protein MLD52_06090 [Puniceicoccaceae bacterium K14]|nr:hypothetical protein [Puniceicoccaceae bacterium K14]